MREIIHNEAGATMVETALTCAMLLTLVLGILAVCQAFYAWHYVALAAREATRYAMVRGSTCSMLDNCPNVTNEEITAYLQGMTFPGITPSRIQTTTTWCTPPPTPACTTTPTADNSPGDTVRVLVQYPMTMAVPFMHTSALTLSSTSQAVISQ